MNRHKNLSYRIRFQVVLGFSLCVILLAGCTHSMTLSEKTDSTVPDEYLVEETVQIKNPEAKSGIRPKMMDVKNLDIPPKLNIPKRNDTVIDGSGIEAILRDLPPDERENLIYEYLIAGNVPDFLRNLVEIVVSKDIDGQTYELRYFVTPDYLSIGTNENYFLMPMTPVLAQRICEKISCLLPTKLMVDQIWEVAPLKLEPKPIPPSDQMTTISVMTDHNKMVHDQRQDEMMKHPNGTLTAGHKKDVILSNLIYAHKPSKRVVIYGWHYLTGKPIQPPYAGHSATYADYSHGIRAVHSVAWLNGDPVNVNEILMDPKLHILISDEGIIENPTYPY